MTKEERQAGSIHTDTAERSATVSANCLAPQPKWEMGLNENDAMFVSQFFVLFIGLLILIGIIAIGWFVFGYMN